LKADDIKYVEEVGQVFWEQKTIEAQCRLGIRRDARSLLSNSLIQFITPKV